MFSGGCEHNPNCFWPFCELALKGFCFYILKNNMRFNLKSCDLWFRISIFLWLKCLKSFYGKDKSNKKYCLIIRLYSNNHLSACISYIFITSICYKLSDQRFALFIRYFIIYRGQLCYVIKPIFVILISGFRNRTANVPRTSAYFSSKGLATLSYFFW